MQDTPESVRNSVIEPRVGMEFDSLLQVIEFYKNYAYSKGFATMTRSSRKNKGFTETSYINLKCNQEGRYSSLVDDASKKRSTIKNSCEAGIKASMDITDRKWRILSFIENHNHDLSPSKSRHFAAFRHISTETKRRLLINDNAGVRVNNSIKSFIVEAGGYENVTYNQKDVRNFLDKERRLKCKEGDGQVLHDYFVRMQVRNKVEKEILSDFECFKGKLECSSSYLMEKQFQGAYTHEIFKRERVTILPDRYILDRWRKDIKRKHTYVSTYTDDVQHNPVLERTEVVRSPMVVKRKGRPRTKRLKSSMEEAVRGSAYGDDSTSNMEYLMSMPHSNDGVIDLTNPMPSQSFVSESMSQSQAHGNEDQALNLT
uniref:FAR1 domain-containing protein n=1 Tax=Fagus sylvatica TaxID=28930 RepID=A0A2N9ITP6_FAGSY